MTPNKEHNMDKIRFAKLKEGAVIPQREAWNAGFDIYPCFDEDYFLIPPHETRLVPTGIASVIPLNYYVQIQEDCLSLPKESRYRAKWFLSDTPTCISWQVR